MKPKTGTHRTKGGSPPKMHTVAPPTTVIVRQYNDSSVSLRNHALHCCITSIFPPWFFVWMGYCVYEACLELEQPTTYVTTAQHPPVYVTSAQHPPVYVTTAQHPPVYVNKDSRESSS